MNGNFFCNQCGAANPAGSRFCSRCGATTEPGAAAAPPPPAAPAAPTAYPAYAARARGYAGFWIRFVAFIIDSILVQAVVVAFVGSPVNWEMSSYSGHPFHSHGGGFAFLFITLAGWLYAALLESSSYQATLGKMILGLKVTDLNGNRLDFARATGRHFAKWVSGLTLLFGFIMAGFTERKQALHDLIAGTLVVRS